MPLPPILTHLFPRPLPYLRTLAVQNKIHALQLEQRRADPGHAPDVLLLLQHRPVYTAGRRQKVEDLQLERARLEGIGADWVQTDRGGQTTYHGPGQLTAYPLLDLGRMKVPAIYSYIVCPSLPPRCGSSQSETIYANSNSHFENNSKRFTTLSITHVNTPACFSVRTSRSLLLVYTSDTGSPPMGSQ